MKWEYKILHVEEFLDIAEWESFLNDMGKHGWELVTILEYGTIQDLYFKRPK